MVEMAEHRPLLVVFLAFAVSLGALGAAAATATVRCGTDSSCSYDLAVAIFAFAPACLIGILVVLLLRTRADINWLRTLLLAVGVGLAAVPLAAFLLGDIRLLPAFAGLVAWMVMLVLWDEKEASPVALIPLFLLLIGALILLMLWGLEMVPDIALFPAVSLLAATMVIAALWGERELSRAAAEGEPAVVREARRVVSRPEAAPGTRPAPREASPAMRSRMERRVALVEQIAAMNAEVARVCELLPAPRTPAGRGG